MVSWQELIYEGFCFVKKLNERYSELNNFQALYTIDPNPGGIGSTVIICHTSKEDGARIAINNIIPISEQIGENPIKVIKAVIAHESFHHKLKIQDDEIVWNEVSREFPEFSQICEKFKNLQKTNQH